jgi:type 1 glutamine amidotransferase
MRLFLPVFLSVVITLCASASDKKIVFVAGNPSHGPGQHEHRAGCLLLQSCLDAAGGFQTVVYSNGWPKDPEAFKDAASIVLYMDGGASHPALQGEHLAVLESLMKKKVGLVCLHYATEPTKDKGEQEFLQWIGGCFEVNWSVNPHWEADFTQLPKHPITRGVRPFKINDEWYFHMRFFDEMKGVTPILTAVAPAATMNRGDGAHEGNPAVKEAVKNQEPQHVVWAYERPSGGRGFGFTGGHFHRNWGNDDFRKVVLNAIAWSAHANIPKDGISSKVSPEQLQQNLDPKGK